MTIRIDETSVLFICCARNGSKGVPDKNIAIVENKPLICYTLDLLKQVPFKNHLVLSTDGDPIAKICRDKVDYLIDRPSDLAEDDTPRWPVLIHAVEQAESYFKCKYDYVFDFLVTSPFRRVEDVIQCYELVQEDGVGNVITGVSAHRNPYFNMVELNDGVPQLVKKLPKQLTRRQDAPLVYDMNGSVYAWKRDFLFSSDQLITSSTRLHVMPEEYGLDVDTAFDLELLELLMRHKVK